MPDILDRIGVGCRFVGEHGGGRLGEPGRDADPQAAGDQLEKRPSSRFVEPVEHPRDKVGHLAARRLAQQRHHLTERGRWRDRVVITLLPIGRRPDQRHGLGQIADIVIGQSEQERVDALLDKPADQARLGMAEIERAGQRRQRPAAIRIRRRAQIIRDQPQLAVALRRQDQAFDQFGEVLHGLVT